MCRHEKAYVYVLCVFNIHTYLDLLLLVGDILAAPSGGPTTNSYTYTYTHTYLDLLLLVGDILAAPSGGPTTNLVISRDILLSADALNLMQQASQTFIFFSRKGVPDLLLF